jgi:hypothetical protein
MNKWSDCQICEIDQITSVALFQREEAIFPGVEFADAWNKFV